MRRDIIKVGAIAIILLMLSSSALAADDPSLATRLINWLRSNIPIFNLKEQRGESAGRRAQGIEHGAKGKEQEEDIRHETEAKVRKPESQKAGPPALRPSGFPSHHESRALSLESYSRSTQTVKLLRFYNYPNPFIPDLGTDFICELDGEATLELKIFGMNGSLVKKLAWNSSESPPHWDGKDNIGRTVRTGMYIYSLRVTDATTGEVTDRRCGKMMAWY